MDTSERAVVKRESQRRRWPVEEKCRIVEQTLKPGASVARVALPTQHAGEGPLVRVQVSDVTYSPNQGDRVKFLLYRTSVGDKLAKAVSLIS